MSKSSGNSFNEKGHSVGPQPSVLAGGEGGSVSARASSQAGDILSRTPHGQPTSAANAKAEASVKDAG